MIRDLQEKIICSYAWAVLTVGWWRFQYLLCRVVGHKPDGDWCSRCCEPLWEIPEVDEDAQLEAARDVMMDVLFNHPSPYLRAEAFTLLAAVDGKIEAHQG